MIEYSYIIDRDEGNKKEEYRPVLPTNLPILSSIEGPNSSGKSTLLHLIGICFEGNKSKSINQSLIGKMSSLLDTSYQDLEFDIKIESYNETLRFVKEKGKSNIDKFRIKGNEKEYIDVEQEYELVYDIPINPVERLKELTKEFKIEQEATVMKLGNFQVYLLGEIEKARTAKDPQRIKDLEDNINKFHEKISEIKVEVSEKQLDLKEIEKCRCVYFYNDYVFKQINNNFLKNKKVKAKKQDNNKLKKEFNSLKSLVGRQKEALSNEYSKIKKTLDGIALIEKDVVDLWKYIDIDLIFSSGKISASNNKTIRFLKSELNKLNTNSEKEIEQYNMVKELVALLQRFIANDVDFPNEIISTKKLMIALEKQMDQQRKSVSIKERINSALESLIIIEKDINFVNSDRFARYQELKTKSGEIFQDISNDDDSDYSELIKQFRQRAISLGIDVENNEVVNHYSSEAKTNQIKMTIVKYSDEEFLKYVDTRHDEITELDKNREKNEDYLNGSKAELDVIKNRPESEYKNYVNEIQTILNNVGDLINKFQQYKSYTDALTDNKTIDTKEFRNYSLALGDYLAKKLGTILHIDNEYKLKSVDVINNTFETIEGKLIRFSDMGTGQSQSAYLRSKLNSYSGKKIVALFDEIAMMDTKSLKPIYKKIIDMYYNGELLTAIVVQKGDKINITSIEEVLT